MRVCRASTVRNDGSWSNTAARNPLTSAGVRRSRWTWVTRWRRSSRGHRLGRGVAARQAVGPVGADEHEAAARTGRARRGRLGEALEHGDALGVGPVQVLEHDERGVAAGPVAQRPHEVDARPHALLGRAVGVAHGRREGREVGVGASSPASAPSAAASTASRNSSIGRPTVPGSAWPASTRVPPGARRTSSCTSRVLPMPASPDTRATDGTGRAPTSAARRSSSTARPTITGDRPVRPTSTR